MYEPEVKLSRAMQAVHMPELLRRGESAKLEQFLLRDASWHSFRTAMFMCSDKYIETRTSVHA